MNISYINLPKRLIGPDCHWRNCEHYRCDGNIFEVCAVFICIRRAYVSMRLRNTRGASVFLAE